MAIEQVNNHTQTSNSQSNQQKSEVSLNDKPQTANGQSNQQQISEDSTFEKDSIELRDEMATLLAAVGHKRVDACNISLVPEQLRKSNAEAYIPQVVSIGPVHRGTRTNLLYMEEIKWRCMKHLFQRTNFNNEEKCLLECTRVMWGLDEMVRASYVDPIKFNRKDLTKISTLDGCFLLELLLSGSPQLSHQIARSLDPEGAKNLGPSPGAEVLKREEVLSDLMLLENQIPFIVLDQLLQVLFGDYNDFGNITELIHKRALSILGYSCSDSEFKAFNIVELVHSLIDKEKDDVDKDSENVDTGMGKVADRKLDIGSEKVEDRKLKLGRCATRLQAAGVNIIGVKTNNEPPYRFDLKIKFRIRELKIPQLHITKTTESKWRNLIAWEVNKTRLAIHRGSTEVTSSCLFISYVWFIQSLICCVHDVKLLRDNNVIVVHIVESHKGKKKKMSDEALLNLFRKMTEGVSKEEIKMDPWFAQEIRKLNSYNRTVDPATATRRITWHYFRRFLTWIWKMCIYSFWGFVATYFPTGWTLIAVIGAVAGLALTAAQTAYAIKAG